MSESHAHLVVSSFGDENTAAGVLQKLVDAAKGGSWGVKEAAVIRKEDDGTISFKEQGDIGAGLGAAAGGILGGLLGLLRGNVVAGGGLGAVLGGAAANALDTGIPDARLREIAAKLPNGSSAVAAVVTEASLAQVRALMEAGSTGTSVDPIQIQNQRVDVPNTGNKTIDDWADKAAAAVVDFAGKAERAVGGLSERAKDAYGDASEVAKDRVADIRDRMDGGDSTPEKKTV